MTSYIARTGGQKKRNILRQRELELLGEIRRGGTREKMERRAERVRAAQEGVIKTLLHEITVVRAEDEDRARDTRQKLLEQRTFWENVAVQEIVRIYSQSTEEIPQVDRKKW